MYSMVAGRFASFRIEEFIGSFGKIGSCRPGALTSVLFSMATHVLFLSGGRLEYWSIVWHNADLEFVLHRKTFANPVDV